MGQVKTHFKAIYSLLFLIPIGCILDQPKHDVSKINSDYWFDTTFYPSGQLESIITMKDSSRNGYSFSLYETGERRNQEHYFNGIKNGWAFTWWVNGQLHQEALAKQGELLLICFKSWDENGVPGRQDTCSAENYLDSTYKQLSHL